MQNGVEECSIHRQGEKLIVNSPFQPNCEASRFEAANHVCSAWYHFKHGSLSKRERGLVNATPGWRPYWLWHLAEARTMRSVSHGASRHARYSDTGVLGRESLRRRVSAG